MLSTRMNPTSHDDRRPFEYYTAVVVVQFLFLSCSIDERYGDLLRIVFP